MKHFVKSALLSLSMVVGTWFFLTAAAEVFPCTTGACHVPRHPPTNPSPPPPPPPPPPEEPGECPPDDDEPGECPIDDEEPGTSPPRIR
jgi:hypothetical protein